MGAKETEGGRWFLPDGREVLTKAGMRRVLQYLHQGSHWDVQNLCDAVLTKFVSPGLYTLARQLVEGCLICRRTNKTAQRHPPQRGQAPGIQTLPKHSGGLHRTTISGQSQIPASHSRSPDLMGRSLSLITSYCLLS